LRFKLPSIEIVPNLRRFFKEISFKPSSLRILAHPGDWPRLCDFNEKPGGSFILAIGPEGGWLEQEVQSFMSHGFQAASISNNILRVDQAVTVGLSQLEFLAPESEVSGYQCSQSSEGVNIPNSKGSFFTSIRSAS